jgi:hypothetical protein
MSCKLCQSNNQKSFDSEISLYLPTLADVNTSPFLVFPKVFVCLDCGFIEGQLSDDDLGELKKS